jgi:hypothetical protein
MRLLKHAYQQGNKRAPYDVLTYCRAEKKGIPVWAVDAIIDDSEAAPRDNGKKSERLFLDGLCYTAVKSLVANDHTWEEAYEKTYALLKPRVQSPEAVKHGYRRGHKLYKAGKLYLDQVVQMRG